MTYAQTARLGGVLFLLALPAMGCGSRKGEVSGKVLYKGQVVPSGSVTFVGEDGQKFFCTIADENHTYTIRDVPPGKVRIAVMSHPRTPPGLNPPWAKKAPGTPPNANGEKAERVVDVPPRYASAEQSGLIYEVRAGSQPHDIDILPP